MPVNQPSYDTAVETNWDGVDQEEFEDFDQFASVHVWWNTDEPETGEDVELPVAHMEDGELKLVYEALNSAHDLASQAVESEENVEQIRQLLENLKEEEFPEREPLDADQDGVKEMNAEEMEEKQEILNENHDQMKTADLEVTGKDVEVTKETSDGEIVVNIPIQALAEDRDGDFINEKGQESIVRQLKSGTVPLVLNHGIGSNDAMYDFRDIVGQFIDGENRNGTTIGTARMRKSSDGEELHQDAKEIVDLLEQDMPIGFSVGFIPQEMDEREEGGAEISDLDLMEVSAVGIPSNPEAVPQAMGTAAQMAKNAGLSQNQIVETVKSAFEDTMSEKQNEDGTDSKEEHDSKSENSQKQMTSEDVEAMMERVASVTSEHMSMAMDEAEDELMAMIDEDEEETDETDEGDDMEEEGEHGDEDEEEMSGEPEQEDDASGHTEDDKDSSAESGTSEEKDEDVEIEETEKQGYDGEPKQMNDNSSESEEEEKSNESETTEDPFAVRELN